MGRGCGRACALAAAGAAVLMGTAVAEAAIPPYTLVGSFPIPAGPWDVVPAGPDAGKLIAMQGDTVVLQSAVNGAGYAAVGSVAAETVSGFGAAFVRVSPSGDRIAIGDNRFPGVQRVHVLDTGTLSTNGPSATVSVIAPNYEAAWASESTLYVTGALDFSTKAGLWRVNVGPTLSATQVVSDIGDASGGVAVHGGRVYTGVGFDFAPAPNTTGVIRSFDLGALGAAASSVVFSSGAFVGDVLSALPLGFDAAGNLLVGGGDSAPENGHAAVIDLVSGARLNLAPAGAQFYGVRFNFVTNELLVSDAFGTGMVYRYAVPAPGALGVIGLAGVIAARRRRRGARGEEVRCAEV